MEHSFNNIDKLVMQGFAYHQQGMLNEAKALYEQVLKIQPKNFSALQLIATLYAQTNNPSKAIDFFSKAIRINPNFAPCYSNRGNALKELGRYSEAIISYDKAISLQADDAYTYSNRGVVLQELGRTEEALASYDKAISLNPNSAECYSNRGVVLQELGRTEEALASYDKAISLNPNFAECFSNRGVVLQELGRTEEALASYDKAISLYFNSPKAHFNRGNALKDLGRFDDALVSYENAISLSPTWAEAHCNRGNALQELNQFDQALVSFDKAIESKPDYSEAYSNRGNALQELGRLEESLESYDRAIQISPNHLDAYSNRGLCLEKLKRLGESLESYDKAIQISADSADIRWNKSLTLLLSGNYEEGWKEYELRWDNKFLSDSKNKRNFSQPLLLGGESLKDKAILIYAEQGLGDTIQFSRYISLVAQLGANVIFEVQPALVNLLKNLEGVGQIVGKGGPLPKFEYQCPLMSLPLVFKTKLDSVPNIVPYIFAEKNKIDYWHKKLISERGLKVGLVWNGGFRPEQPKLWSVNNRRNIPVSLISAALSNLNVNFYSLQKGEPAESEIKRRQDELWPNKNFINYSDELHDFSDTAALIENLDLIISVDTSTAHLAAAMGKPVWLLNRFDSCWRWLVDRDDSPWYSSIKIYRQSKMNDWDSVLARIRIDIENLCKISM
jgi:tetratricopeptide (TPR) repeat protein